MVKYFFAIICSTLIFMSCEEDRFIDQPGRLVPRLVTQDSSLSTINVNGAKLHGIAFGPSDSTLIICLHGGPGGNFKYLLNTISLAAKGYRVVLYDQRGSGLSQRFSEDWYRDQGSEAIQKTFYDDLNAIIDMYKTHEDQKVVLLTQSWGSMMGTGFAGKYPDKVDGLILAEPGGLKWDDVMTYINDSRAIGLWTEALNDATYMDQFLTSGVNDHEVLDYKFALLSSSNSVVGDGRSELGDNAQYYQGSRDGAVIGTVMLEIGDKYKPDFSVGISNFTKPVLFMYSSINEAYPDSWAEKIASVIPNKDLKKMNGVGHSGMFDQLGYWTQITEPLILEYLKKI